MSRWPEYMSSASDEALSAYINDYKKYLPVAVEAAIAELAKRGRPLSDEELALLRNNILVAQEERRMLEAGIHDDITDDPNAPLLYTPSGVYGCTFLFGAIFGSILFCMNLHRIKKTAWTVPVLISSVGVTTFQALALPSIKGGQIIGVFVSLFYAYLLHKGLWKNLTRGLKYRKRSILFPVLIGFGLAILLIAAIFKRLL